MAKKPLIFFKIMVYFSIENWYTFRLTNTPIDIKNCVEEITADEEQQGNGDSIEKVAGLEEVGAVQIPVSKGRTRDISGFWLTLQSAGRAKRTIEGYQQDIKQWQKYTLEKGHKTVYNLKLKEIEGFIAKRDVNTARRLISSLKQLSKWYLRDGFPADYRMEGDNQSVRMV